MEESVGFDGMGLDRRILECIASLGWKTPTLFQGKAIPLVLEGKDVLGRGRTGCGKTGAFLVPIIHKIVVSEERKLTKGTRVLILVPNAELSRQTAQVIRALSPACQDITCTELCLQGGQDLEKLALMNKPDIVVGIPSRVLKHIQAGNLTVKCSLQYLILDEADLLYTYDFKKDILKILGTLPSAYQTFVASATLSSDVKHLKKLLLSNAVTVKFEEPIMPLSDQLSHYVIKLDHLDKLTLLYAIFTFEVIKGKTIVFVNSRTSSQRLNLFFNQLAIKSIVIHRCVPNEERCRLVMEFNNDKHNLLIIADEAAAPKEMAKTSCKKILKRSLKKLKYVGVSRGIDFQYVKNIINFDFPSDLSGYIHRVGRTARGINTGIALSLVSSSENDIFYNIQEALKLIMPEGEGIFHDFKFDLRKLDGLRYRAETAWDFCMSRDGEAILKSEIKKMNLTSLMMTGHFSQAYISKRIEKMDIFMGKVEAHKPQLQNIPDYIVPSELKKKGTRKLQVSDKQNKDKWVPPKNQSTRNIKKKKQLLFQAKKRKEQSDPLLTGNVTWKPMKK